MAPPIPSSVVRLGVTGCTGRMGQTLVREIEMQTDNLVYGGGTVRDAAKASGGLVFTNSAQLFPRVDVVIDFTTPEATLEHVALASQHKIPMVIGTTGLKESEVEKIRSASKDVAIVLAPNTSVGVTVLLSLVEQASRLLGAEFDMEISEIHHKRKVDAPSGTALALGQAAAKGRHQDWPKAKLPAREGITGPRPAEGVGFGVLRGGDVVGEHTVYYFGEGERVELTHRATDRKLFARGALRAARWVATQPPGFYSMRDVLGLA